MHKCRNKDTNEAAIVKNKVTEFKRNNTKKCSLLETSQFGLLLWTLACSVSRFNAFFINKIIFFIN